MFLYILISVVSTPIKETCLCNRDQYQKPQPTDTSTTQLLYLQPRDFYGEEPEKLKSKDNRACYGIVSSTSVRSYTNKSHQHDYLNMSLTRMIPVNMLTCKGGNSEELIPTHTHTRTHTTHIPPSTIN